MPNLFHKNIPPGDIHGQVDEIYVTIAERDADTVWPTLDNAQKVIKVVSPLSFYTLVNNGSATVSNSGGNALFTSTSHNLLVGYPITHSGYTESSYNGEFVVTAVPTGDTYEVGLSYVSDDTGRFVVWFAQGSTGFRTFLDLNDTPGAYGGAGKVVQTNSADDGLEFGQALRTTDNVDFNGLLTTAFLATEFNAVELNENNETDVTADGGGLLLKATTEKRFVWASATDDFTLNTGLEVEHEVSIGALSAPATDTSLDLKATDKVFALNSVSTAVRDTLSPPSRGVIYNPTTSQFEGWNGSMWVNFGAGGGTVVGPVSAIDNELVTFDLTTGQLIQGGTGFTAETGLLYGVDAAGAIQIKAEGFGNSRLSLRDSAAALDDKQFDIVSEDGALYIGHMNDAEISLSPSIIIDDNENVLIPTGRALNVGGIGTVDSDTDAQFTNGSTRSTVKIKGANSARLNVMDESAPTNYKQFNLISDNGSLRIFQSNDDLTTGSNLVTMGLLSGDFTLDKGQLYHQNDKSVPTPSQAATLGDNVVEVWQESNLGVVTPGVSIAPEDGKVYYIMTPVSQTLPFVGSNLSIEYRSTNKSSNKITYTNTTDPQFQFTDSNVAVWNTLFECGTTGTLLDVNGGVLSFKAPDFVGYSDLGQVENLVDFYGPGIYFNIDAGGVGLDMINCSGSTFSEWLVEGLTGDNAVLNISGASSGDIQINDNILFSDGSTTLVDIASSYPVGNTVNLSGNNIQGYDVAGQGLFKSTSLNQEDDRVISRGNKGAPDSTARIVGIAHDQAGVATSFTAANEPLRIEATFTEVLAERFSVSSVGVFNHDGIQPITAQVTVDITGQNDVGTGIKINFYIGKGAIGTGITGVTDAGGGDVTVTTEAAHGLVTNDRVNIQGTTSYNGTYTVISSTATTFNITHAYNGSETGFNPRKILEYAKGSNTFSGTDKNTGINTQVGMAEDEFFQLFVENASSTTDWETSDISVTISKI